MLKFIKTTIVGGVIFLIPLILLLMLLGKALDISKKVAAPIYHRLPIDSFAGIAVAEISAILLILLVCFVAGMLAISKPGKKLFAFIDSKLILYLPVYAFIKSMTGALYNEEEANEYLKPVLVTLDDQQQIGFEVECCDQNHSVVFFPGAPDPKSGTVAYINPERIEHLDANFKEVFQSLRRLGLGAGKIITTGT